MRVLLDCRMAEWSGVGRYTRGLAGALARRDDVELVQLVGRGQLPPVADDAEAIAIAGSPLTPRGARGYARVAREIRPDVVHSAHFPTPMPSVHPLVVTLHDVSPLAVPAVMPSRLRRTVYSRMADRAVRVADRIVAPSAFTARELQRVLGAPAEHISVTPYAADDFTSVAAATLPDELVSWLSGAPYVLSMGNTKPHKDLPTLLAAFQSLVAGSHERRPADTRGLLPSDLRLLLVGRDVASYLVGWLTDPAAAKRARFTGAVTDGQLRTLYEGAALFAFPSRYEGFGLPPLEAMQLGTPVVVASAASLPEVVGDAALTVPPQDPAALADAMRRILDDAALAKQLRARGRERAAGFSWAHTAELTMDVYRGAIAAASGGTPAA